MLNEMIDLGHGITGLALNLDQNEVGVVILGDYTELSEGDEVRTRASCCRYLSAKGSSDVS
jgi:F-type H+-transporting ATPase subunit alpha